MDRKIPITAILLVFLGLVLVTLGGAKTTSADSVQESSEPELTKETCGVSGKCIPNCGCGCKGNPQNCGCGR